MEYKSTTVESSFMKIQVLEYTVFKNRIVLRFDKTFQRINYIKMEQRDYNTCNNCSLECEEMTIKYSKPTSTLNVFLHQDCQEVVILITEIDNTEIHYAYKANTGSAQNTSDQRENTIVQNTSDQRKNTIVQKETTKQQANQESNTDLMARGFQRLFTGDIKGGIVEDKDLKNIKDLGDDKNIRSGGNLSATKQFSFLCPIKNQNIFAKVTKK